MNRPMTAPEGAAVSAADLPVLGVCLPNDAIEEKIDWIVQDQRDLEVQDFFSAEVLDGDWRAVAARTRRLLGSYKGRLGIHGPFWGFSLGTMDPLVREVVKKRMDQGLDACEEIGATQMVIHSPATTWDYNNRHHLPGAYRIADNLHAALDDAAARAQRIGVTLVLENIEDKDPAERVRLAESFGIDAVRVSVDTGHAHYAHKSTGAPPVDHYILAAGDMLHHVHIQDADGYADRHWAPGMGDILWGSVFKALEHCGSSPRLNLELRDKSLVEGAAEWFRARGLAR
ncbi:MAG: sugar phosphate isomerase/epimerase family protein [Pseudomonadota bacterium]|nr:sugar phosphate isomerase/epimerase family protein [Pseudomonadota bacterium]